MRSENSRPLEKSGEYRNSGKSFLLVRHVITHKAACESLKRQMCEIKLLVVLSGIDLCILSEFGYVYMCTEKAVLICSHVK